MALDSAPESTVWVPGERASWESRDVAKVIVVNGSESESESGSKGRDLGGR